MEATAGSIAGKFQLVEVKFRKRIPVIDNWNGHGDGYCVG